jgi:urea transport system ATP-binding protein
MAIVLVEQYFEFARDLASAYIVMQRGEVVLSGRGSKMNEAEVRTYLTV